MIPLLLLCLCIIDPITATSTAKELLIAEQKSDSLNALDDTAMEEFSHLISIIGSKGSRSEKRLIRLSLTRLTFNTLYTNGSPELKESLNTFTQNLTHALATIAWSTHTKEVRVNALLRMAFADLKELAKNQPQKELILSLQKNLHIGLAPALTGLRETLRKKIPLKTLLALTIIAAGGFAAYKMSLGKKILHRVIDTTKNKLSREFAAMQHLGELARTNEAEFAAYQHIQTQNPNLQEVLNPRTGRLELRTEEATYVRPESSVNKAIHAFHTATSLIPHVTERLAAETAKDTAWFNQYNILTHPDGSPQMVRVHYGEYDEMRYLSSDVFENANPTEEEKSNLKLYHDNGRWHKTYLREPLVKTILGQVDRGLAMANLVLPLAHEYRLLINRALQLAEQYREIANRGVAILENPVVINFIDSIGTITKANLAQTFTWLKTNGFIREGGTTPADLAANVRNRFDQATRTMTFYKVGEDGGEIAGSAQNMPKSIIDNLTTVITQLTADGSASAELIKAITQQINNGLQNNKAFLQHFCLWDEETNKIKTTITNARSTYPVEFNQDNGRPYYRVALAAFSPREQAKFRTNAAGGSVAIPTPAQQTTGTPGVGAGAGNGSTAVAEIRPMTTEVIIEQTNSVEYVKIYAPLTPFERLFLVLDRANIEKTSDLLITLRPEIYEIILGLKIGKIDPLSQTFRASLNAKLLPAQAAAERIMRERR
jgi:hypothetical protein